MSKKRREHLKGMKWLERDPTFRKKRKRQKMISRTQAPSLLISKADESFVSWGKGIKLVFKKLFELQYVFRLEGDLIQMRFLGSEIPPEKVLNPLMVSLSQNKVAAINFLRDLETLKKEQGIKLESGWLSSI